MATTSPTAAAYVPALAGPRTTILAAIAVLHGALLAAVLVAGGRHEALRRAAALEVRLLAEPPRRDAAPTPPPLPPPKLSAPALDPPPMPLIESAPVPVVDRRPAAPAADPVQPGPSREALSPASASTGEPPVVAPRFDLAYLRNPAPAYPPLSRRLKEQGRVLLRVQVGSSGEVLAIEVAASSGHPRLDQAAVSAVRAWRFTPARQGERPVPGWAMVPVLFQLQA